MTIERKFLGWHAPFLGLAADWLLEDRDALPTTLVIVPTSQAGRRMREAMAETAGALLSPKFVTPGSLLRTPDPSVAADWIEQLAWLETMEAIKDWSAYDALFPEPPEAEGTWADSLSVEFVGLRRSLQEAGLTLEAAANLLGNSIEAERWACLKRLEKSMESKLRQWGYDSRSRILARGISMPHGISRILLVGLTELAPILRKALTQCGLPITALIGAPDAESNHFCEFGTPLIDWSEKIIPLPETDQVSIHLVADSKQQAAEAVRLVAEAQTPSHALAIGCGDAGDGETLERTFAENGWVAFHPGARTITTGLTRWFALWTEWLAKGKLSTVADLLALPESTTLAGSQRVEAARSLAILRDKHLITNADDLQRLIHSSSLSNSWLYSHAHALLPILESFEKKRVSFERIGADKGISEMLAELAEHADPTSAEWIAMQDFVAKAAPLMRQLQRRPDFWVSLMLSQVPSPLPQPPDNRALDIQGWLELFFEPGTHLVLCGMNEGRVPASVSNDPWLGEKARAWLGLITSNQRAARDAFLFRSMLEARRATGKVDILCAKSGQRGEALLPSRLLLAAPAEELPARVKKLFEELQPPESSLKWTRDWLWQTGSHTDIKKIHVTSFRSYLSCPYRFYLGHVCKMQASDPERNEWDHRDFGNIAHLILEAFGRDAEIRDSDDSEKISQWLSKKLDETVAQLHGDTPSLAIRIQKEALRQRLRWASKVQAEERAKGWKIREVEVSAQLTIGEYLITAKIDRIDEHEKTGELRVFDYKTGKVDDVQKKHIKKQSTNKERPPHLADDDCAAYFVREGKNKIESWQWIDLQLPLYAKAILERDQKIATPAYFAIGDTEKHVRISEWENFSQDEIDLAVSCADWIGKRIRQGIFWPPAEKPNFDDYKVLSCGKSLIDMCASQH